MTQAEFELLKRTFPWTERTTLIGAGGLIQVIDRNGNEVPIFVMTEFLEMITTKLAKKPAEQEQTV